MIGPVSPPGTMKWLILLNVLLVSSSGEDCQSEVEYCSDGWNSASYAETTDVLRCAIATGYELCLEDVTQMSGCEDYPVEVPLALKVEQAITCHAPAEVSRYSTECEAARLECYTDWSSLVTNTTRAADLCGLAKQWRTCLQATVSNFICQNMGEDGIHVEGEILLNCVGASQEECEAKQQTCKDAHDQTDSSTDEERCQKARAWRECLVATVRDGGTCDESVSFPSELDQAESENCVDWSPVLSCDDQARECYDAWAVTISPATPLRQRCSQALTWTRCLRNIILAGGCPGGYSIDSQAQVEKALACHLVYVYQPDECNYESLKCLADFSVNRKYQSDDEVVCDDVLHTRECYNDLVNRGICSEDTPEPEEIALAEGDFCQARYDQQECDAKGDQCAEDFNAQELTLPSEICTAADAWILCIATINAEGCTVDTPVEVYEQLTYCYIADPTTQLPTTEPPPSTEPPLSSCDIYMNACAELYYNPSDPTLSICTLADDWRHCLEDLRDFCEVIYPYDLEYVQANYC